MHPEEPDDQPLKELFEAAEELESEAAAHAQEAIEAAPHLAERVTPDSSPWQPANPGRRSPALIDDLLGWAEAVVLGLGDTFNDVLRAGRRGAREAQSEYWTRFDRKTRYRRKPPSTPAP